VKKEIKTKIVKKETSTEMLAHLMVNGFEQVNQRFEKVSDEIASFKQEVHARFSEVDSRLDNLTSEQKETNRRLDSLEKKQMGTLLSLDETVHRNEFEKLSRRVEVLEK